MIILPQLPPPPSWLSRLQSRKPPWRRLSHSGAVFLTAVEASPAADSTGLSFPTSNPPKHTCLQAFCLLRSLQQLLSTSQTQPNSTACPFPGLSYSLDKLPSLSLHYSFKNCGPYYRPFRWVLRFVCGQRKDPLSWHLVSSQKV